MWMYFAIQSMLSHKRVNYICSDVAQFSCALHNARKLARKNNLCVVISCERARQEVKRNCLPDKFIGSVAQFLSMSSAQML